MFRTHLWTAALLALAFVLPLSAADKGKPADKKKDDDSVSAGTLNGKIVHIEPAGKGFRLEVQVPVPNPAAAQAMANLQAQLRFATSPSQVQSIMNQMAQQQRNMVKMEAKQLDVEPAPNMIVRTKNPPPAFDEKGNIKRYTSKELKELKGDDPKLPGYTGDMDSLKNGQLVTVQLIKKKEVGNPKPRKKEDADFLAENRPQVKMILIVADPPSN